MAIPGVGQVLPGQGTVIPPPSQSTHSVDIARLKKREKLLTKQPEYGGGSGSGGCGDDEPGDDEDGGEDEEEEDDISQATCRPGKPSAVALNCLTETMWARRCRPGMSLGKNKDGGGRKLTTACKGYHFDVSMSDIDVNKLYHMEDAYGSSSWNSRKDLVLQIRNLKTRKEMWEAIKTRNLGAERVKEARLQTLITEFENTKMLDNGTIDEYAANLPTRFVHIVAALEQVLDLKTTGFEDVVSRLKAYEERVKEEDKANDPQENLLYARTEYSNGNNDSSGGR
nr:hypothetical protein [Tanacetum cinerariifolium]